MPAGVSRLIRRCPGRAPSPLLLSRQRWRRASMPRREDGRGWRVEERHPAEDERQAGMVDMSTCLPAERLHERTETARSLPAGDGWRCGAEPGSGILAGVHKTLAESGIQVRPSGSGLVYVVGDVEIRASRVSRRRCSKRPLRTPLGPSNRRLRRCWRRRRQWRPPWGRSRWTASLSNFCPSWRTARVSANPGSPRSIG